MKLGDGSRGMLPERWLERWQWLEMGREGEDGEVRFARHQAWLIDALLDAQGRVDTDVEYRRFVDGLAKFERIEAVDPPSTFRGELRGYQREGLGWFAHLERLGIGGCLADDMGLGKTVQVLAWLESRRTRRAKKGEERRPSLVVVPRSLLFNWKDEAARFTPRMRVALHHGTGRGKLVDETFAADLVLTTYGTLRRDAALFDDQPFDVVVLDEAQAIKNEGSQASKAVRLLEARQRVALSGTPVENHIDELWALFEFLNPGMLGSVPAFRRLLAGKALGASAGDDPEEAAERRNAAIRAVGRAIRPFFLRRTKDAVLTDLPEKTEQIVHVELPARQRKAYDAAADYYRARFLGADVVDEGNGESFDTMIALTAILRLRQLACHQGLVDAERAKDPSGKLDELVPMLAELVGEGHKAVVFSQFTTFLDLVADRLENEGLAFTTLTGATRDRKKPVELFQNDPSTPILLVSLKAGGTGLNLTAADYVFLLDPWWNPAVEAQAVDRAHRIGRTRPVHAYRLVARDTIESRVLELQASKRLLAATLMDGAAASAGEITREDLRALLG
ncbi:MAG: DEAD/DEAH box helicase [Planctomycetota bacterium]